MIDEFGAGTEPQSGGAIAEAILESLNQKGAWGVVTTHYANLKLLASEHQGFVNGAMLYDTRQMRPLFLLRTGRPGSSFAFEIAANIQLPAEILNSAADKIGRGKLDFDKQMQDFEAEKLALNLKEKQLEQADEMLSSLINKYTGLSRDLERRQKEIIESANSEAKNIIKNSNRLIENTIREIKQSNAESNRTKELRKEIADYAETIDKPLEISSLPPIVEPEPKQSGTIAVGRRVRLIGQHESGEVAEINGNEVTIAFNTFSLKADISTLELLQDKKPVAKTVNRGIAYQNMVNDMNARLANFRIKIDVRGKRAEETEPIIQKYVDEAAMLHIREISILHGKGNGVLRLVIRNILQAHPEVKSFSDAPLETGGAGITMVTLK
jgi:DNA mismatch repair protein MutS2